MKRKLRAIQVLLVGVILFPLLLVYCYEHGRDVKGIYSLEVDGRSLGKSLVLVKTTRRRWHWYYDTFVVGSEKSEKLLDEATPDYRYCLTDEQGRIALDEDNIVEIELLVFQDVWQYSYRRSYTCCSRQPQRIRLTKNDFFAPALHDESVYKSFLEGESLDYTGIRDSQLLVIYFHKLSERNEVLFLRIISDVGDTDLVNGIPLEVRFHGTSCAVLKGLTDHGSVCVFVPPGHTYDIVFHPDKTDWPGMSPDSIVPKPLEPLTVRNIQPRHLPKEPFETIILKHTKDYTPDWGERALAQRMSRENSVRKLSPIVLKLKAASRSLMEHWALVLLVLVPFVAPWIVRRVLGSGEKKADKDR